LFNVIIREKFTLSVPLFAEKSKGAHWPPKNSPAKAGMFFCKIFREKPA
jgi:hypothetical protein